MRQWRNSASADRTACGAFLNWRPRASRIAPCPDMLRRTPLTSVVTPSSACRPTMSTRTRVGRRAIRPPSRARGPCRCWAAADVWSRARHRRPARPPAARGPRRKTGDAIPRGEFGHCDPRRSHATTGASVRLASVVHTHPYSPRRRAQRGYERRRFSRPAEEGRGRPVPVRRSRARVSSPETCGQIRRILPSRR